MSEPRLDKIGREVAALEIEALLLEDPDGWMQGPHTLTHRESHLTLWTSSGRTHLRVYSGPGEGLKFTARQRVCIWRAITSARSILAAESAAKHRKFKSPAWMSSNQVRVFAGAME